MAPRLRTALPFVAAMGVIALPSDVVRHAVAPLASPYRDGVYVGPFTNLTDTFLNVVNLTDGYGPEDKLQACSGTLVFIDLDSDGEWFAYNGTWDRGIVTLNNLCPVGSQLFPRGNGYTVGTALSPVTGLDRLIILGGADAASKHNVYYSDDCGRSWSCSSAPQVWPMQDYASIVRAPTNYGADITIMGAGGSLTGDTFGNFLFSGDGGISWGRPQCASASPCQADCEALHRTICTLADFEPDATGNCNNASDWRLCYIMPDWPVYPGALATDWDALWLWMEYGNRVWRLAAGEITTGWNLTTARWGGYGRKVFIKGTVPGSGCWFSTDFLLEDTWAARTPDPNTTSTNAFATAPTPYGPWVDWGGRGLAPWAPRASAAVASAPGMAGAWLASGNNWTAGVPGLPTYADVWQIDAGVCLLSPATDLVCSGFGDPDLDQVKCNCDPAYQGNALCSACTPGFAHGPFPLCRMCAAHQGAPCGAITGRGTCDPDRGCVCNAPYAGPDSGCASCDPGFWGPACAPCTVCGAHGSCNGSGTGGGTGECVCDLGWTGDQCRSCSAGWAGAECDACAGGYYGPLCYRCPDCGDHGSCNGTGTHSGSGACVCTGGWGGEFCDSAPPPAAAAGSTPGVNGGAVAAGVIFALLAVGAGGVAVWARWFGGYPTLLAAWTKLRASVGGSGAAAAERAAIIRKTPVSAEAAQARFGSAKYSAVGSG